MGSLGFDGHRLSAIGSVSSSSSSFFSITLLRVLMLFTFMRENENSLAKYLAGTTRSWFVFWGLVRVGCGQEANEERKVKRRSVYDRKEHLEN